MSIFDKSRVGTWEGNEFVTVGKEGRSGREKMLKATKGTATGSRSRGGKRTVAAEREQSAFKTEIARQVGGEKQVSAKAKTTSKPKPAAKAGPTEKFTRKPIAKTGSTTVQDVQNKIEAPKKSAIKPAKRDVKLGVIGRTGGKWHLGKKVGKG
jgi:hypothetical protein